MLKKLMVFLLVINVFSFMSCDDASLGLDVGVGINDKTLLVLLKLMDDLNKMPENWEELIINSIDELGTVGEDLALVVSHELQEVLDSTQMLLQGTIMCSTDFVIDRVKTEIQAIGYNFFPIAFEEPLYLPRVCSTSPRDIITTSDKIVTFSGYYFLKYGEGFTASIEDGYGTVLVSDLDIAITSDYQLAVNLQTVNWSQLVWTVLPNSPQLVLRWNYGYSEIFLSICDEDHPAVPNPEADTCINSCVANANLAAAILLRSCGDIVCVLLVNAAKDKKIAECNTDCNAQYPETPAYTDYHICEQ